MGNLTQRSTSISLNPNQEYPIFDESILQNIIDDIGKNLVTELNTLLGYFFLYNITFIYFLKKCLNKNYFRSC